MVFSYFLSTDCAHCAVVSLLHCTCRLSIDDEDDDGDDDDDDDDDDNDDDDDDDKDNDDTTRYRKLSFALLMVNR